MRIRIGKNSGTLSLLRSRIFRHSRNLKKLAVEFTNAQRIPSSTEVANGERSKMKKATERTPIESVYLYVNFKEKSPSTLGIESLYLTRYTREKLDLNGKSKRAWNFVGGIVIDSHRSSMAKGTLEEILSWLDGEQVAKR